jgi:hypothetical protein
MYGGEASDKRCLNRACCFRRRCGVVPAVVAHGRTRDEEVSSANPIPRFESGVQSSSGWCDWSVTIARKKGPTRPRTDSCRTLATTLKHGKKNVKMYVTAYTKKLRKQNKGVHAEFGAEHKHLEVIGYWDHVCFTNEAQINPLERFQKPRILREEGTHEETENVVEEEDIKRDHSIHVYTYVNYYEKGPLEFYNNERDMIPKPKRPPKPRRSKFDDDLQFEERVKEWEASLPLGVNQVAQGAHMTQNYYTEHM